MQSSDLDTLLDCVRGGRRLFHYFRDRYALMLLAWAAGDGARVADLKRGRFAGLLRKPVVNELLASLDDGVLTADRLSSVWPPQPEAYVVTFGRWGNENPRKWARRWHQTSRRGENLVLQLNFSNRHDRRYRALPWRTDATFNCPDHPVDTTGRLTLAWARLDIELDRGEALVEEVQSDWVHGAGIVLSRIGKDEPWAAPQRRLGRSSVTVRQFWRYYREVLAPHVKLWDEAVLAAALEFLVADLGVRRVWYHTFESGLALKAIRGGSRPPRSLYTSLPRRFRFEQTGEAPPFLWDGADGYARYELRRRGLRWHVLDIA
jgi:hypothetical protein